MYMEKHRGHGRKNSAAAPVFIFLEFRSLLRLFADHEGCMAIIKNKRLLLLRDELISEIEKKSYPESAYTQELLKSPLTMTRLCRRLKFTARFDA